MTSIANLLESLPTDEWRETNAFSPEMLAANTRLERRELTFQQQCDELNQWLMKHQPCVFGRVAARLNTITYCILGDDDLRKDDEHIYRRIQEARAQWKALAYDGHSSAFIIALLSPTLASAAPSDSLFQLARRICQLYLVVDDIEPDTIYTDAVELGVPRSGGKRSALIFDVGVNFFAAAADGRWWQDHRIPGGIAFSMNAVGHLVKSGQLRNALADVESLIGYTAEEAPPKLESLGEALRWAMQTIAGASPAISGPATTLLPLSSADREHLPGCPIQLPRGLADKNHCQYAGWYHTDITLPSEYFRPDSSRCAGLGGHSLDFTYLFDDHLDNLAFRRIAQGIRIRGIQPTRNSDDPAIGLSAEAVRKRRRAIGFSAPLQPDEQRDPGMDP